MNRATGSESTPTRRNWTSVSRPQTPTSGTARARSRMKWPKRPTVLTASTVLRPIRSITAVNYDATLDDAMLYDTKEMAGGIDRRPLLQHSAGASDYGAYAAKLASAFPTSPSRNRLSAVIRRSGAVL